MMQIDAKGMHYREMNRLVKEAAWAGETEFVLDNVNGQRYIGTGVNRVINIVINGVPGNDLAAFSNGPNITVNANGQDNIGNTMNSGEIIVHGGAGDVLGYGMRGGRILIRDSVGYRVGIHMKEYRKQIPVMVIGGTAGDFFGEYMGGGIIVLLGLGRGDAPLAGDYLGTGMHGGVIYLRGEADPYRLGKEVSSFDIDEADEKVLKSNLQEFSKHFGMDYEEIRKEKFTKLLPVSSRPYGRLYAG